MDQKWQNTIEVFDEYERRFAAARVEKKLTRPWQPEDRNAISDGVKQMLGWKDEWVPQIRSIEEISRTRLNGCDAIQYRFQSWDHFYGCFTLYLPPSQDKLPLVFVCCGHGNQGRLTGSYAAIGLRLAKLGMAALVPDNIGQGDRSPRPDETKTEDHWFSLAPFFCGTTLQGLIVMETVALIRAMKADSRFDPDRFAACGNSGGGTLTLFLAAMCPELSVLASSGYPSEISFVLSKERRHCACNLLLGSCHGPEMWEIYSLFAPKPLLLEGGKSDILIPMDLAHRNARKVRNTYVQTNASEQFEFELTNTGHSWESDDLNRISSFLSRRLLGQTPHDCDCMELPDNIDSFHVLMPTDALSTNGLAEALSGIKIPEDLSLSDIFPPTYRGKPLRRESLQEDVGRGMQVMRVFAQYECALKNISERRPSHGKKD